MKALILAAGYATRLYPLTKEYPKPLLDVGGRPIIDYIIDKLGKIEAVDEIIVITNNKFIGQFKNWKIKLHSQKEISLVDDLTKSHSDRRGAIGDMDFAINNAGITEDLLVVGGDNLFEDDLNDFLSFTRLHRSYPVIGVYNIKSKTKAQNYGVIRLDQKNKIIDFQEKPDKPKSALVAMCLYYFSKERLGLVREYINTRRDKHDATGLYIDWLRKQMPVYGFIFNGYWYDIGHHQFYNEAREKFN